MTNPAGKIVIIARQNTLPQKYIDALRTVGEIHWPCLYTATNTFPSARIDKLDWTTSLSDILGFMYQAHVLLVTVEPYLVSCSPIGYNESNQYDFLLQRVLMDHMLAHKTIIVQAAKPTQRVDVNTFQKLLTGFEMKTIKAQSAEDPWPLVTSVRAKLK